MLSSLMLSSLAHRSTATLVPSLCKAATTIGAQQRRQLQTSPHLQQPSPFQYDNQKFYDGIRFGYKKVRENIRNQHLHPDFFRKRCGLQKMSQVRIVDNSKWSKIETQRNIIIIQVYNKLGIANVGDMVLITVGGHLKKALVVGQRQLCGVGKARADSSNVIILDDSGSPRELASPSPSPRGFVHTNQHSDVPSICPKSSPLPRRLRDDVM